ncbi:hypothetical protein CDD82_5328 [Ophiocordyceps australis]|uniref:Uncharacterized protein n=1 Tax=Ophiocordyceps australis TaxID=1399860 RepID=A0A2C5XIJ3_9HYPO|nr:hypothetical protein CDD82_5328 [Ophiocordyceps australis]
MPRRAATSATSRSGTTKSIRGHISGPMPIHNSALTKPDVAIRHAATSPVALAPYSNCHQDHTTPERLITHGQTKDTLPPFEPPCRDDVAPSRYSEAVPTSAARSGASPCKVTMNHAAPPKKSPLRSALDKLFGRNKKKSTLAQSGHLSTKAVPKPSSRHHRSDPTGQHVPIRTLEPKRSASLPVTEYDRALRSHSIGPDDVRAIRSARNSINADPKTSTYVTALLNSSPYLMRPAQPRWTETRKFTGLSPRPASSHARRSKMTSLSHDGGEIGRAITSDSASGLRRRSRSLAALHLPDTSNSGHIRRRSDDIRQWRDNFEPAAGSLLFASTAPEVENLGTSSPSTADEPETVVEEQTRPPQSQIADEDIGSVKEAARLRITEAANLSSRLTSLEARISRLEPVLAGLDKFVWEVGSHPNTPGQEIPSIQVKQKLETTGQVPRNRASDYEQASPIRPSMDRSNASEATFGGALLHHNGSQKDTLQPLPLKDSRPPSLTTIRNNQMATVQPLTPDVYASLLALIESERIARQALAAQVRRLSHQLNLRTKSTGHVRPAQSHLPRGDKPVAGIGLFDQDEGVGGCGTNGGEHSRHSMRLDDSGFSAGNCDDEHSESCAGPYEGDGDDSDSGEDDEIAIRTATRALSLSRLTHGKMQPTRLEGIPRAMV